MNELAKAGVISILATGKVRSCEVSGVPRLTPHAGAKESGARGRRTPGPTARLSPVPAATRTVLLDSLAKLGRKIVAN